MVDALIERDGTKCVWCCREMLDKPIDPNKDCSLHMTVEHMYPLFHGGSHEIHNLALACFQCNNARGSFLGAFEPSWAVE